MDAGVVGLVVVVAAVGALIAVIELGLFDWTADTRPLDPQIGRSRGWEDR